MSYIIQADQENRKLVFSEKEGDYESLGLDASSGKLGCFGARRHLKWGHEKYIIDTIQSHPAQLDMHSFGWFKLFVQFRT
ncbi:hypothetical protein CsSME_00048422 [Camellia sinensis var. sinensis]